MREQAGATRDGNSWVLAAAGAFFLLLGLAFIAASVPDFKVKQIRQTAAPSDRPHSTTRETTGAPKKIEAKMGSLSSPEGSPHQRLNLEMPLAEQPASEAPAARAQLRAPTLEQAERPEPMPPLPPRNEARADVATVPPPVPKPARAETASGAEVALPQRNPARKAAPVVPPVAKETGRASWYDFHQQVTASGELMDATALTAAHPTLPLGTHVRVEHLENGRSVVVRVNDRGPFAGGRIIDLSKAAAKTLDMIADGVAKVRISPVAQAVASADTSLE